MVLLFLKALGMANLKSLFIS